MTDIEFLLLIAALLGWGLFGLAMYQWRETLREWGETLDAWRECRK